MHHVLTVGPKNAEAVTGLPWRWLRDHFPELVIRIDGKSMIPAEPLRRALEARAATKVVEPEPAADDLEAFRARIAGAR